MQQRFRLGGLKLMRVPGRFNIVSLNVSKKGVYYGQCSELCGALHAYMPLMIYAVEPDEYIKFMKQLNKRKDELEAGKITTMNILEDLGLVKNCAYRGSIKLQNSGIKVNDEVLQKMINPPKQQKML